MGAQGGSGLFFVIPQVGNFFPSAAMNAQFLQGEPTPSQGKRLPRWAVAALSSAATIAAYQAFSSPLSDVPQSSEQLFSVLGQQSWTLPNGETSLKQALTNIENEANNQSAAIQRLQAPCHPLHNQDFKLWVQGYNDYHGYAGELEQWLSFNNDGHWMIAGYSQKNDASPLRFRAFPDECNTYYLQNTYNHDDHWLGFADCGKWIRAIYQFGDAMPIKFIDQGEGLYKMKNMWPGQGFYVAYTNGATYECGYEHPAHSLRVATYTSQSGMTVSLHSP